MELLKKMQVDSKEYVCIQFLQVKDKIVYKLYEEESGNTIWAILEKGNYYKVTDEKLLEEIEVQTNMLNTDLRITPEN